MKPRRHRPLTSEVTGGEFGVLDKNRQILEAIASNRVPETEIGDLKALRLEPFGEVTGNQGTP